MNMNFNDMQMAQFRVLQCIVPTSGTYGDMHSRDFSMNASAGALASLTENTNGFRNISQEALRNASGTDINLMRINAQSAGTVTIADGWFNQRNIIILMLENVSTKTVYIISGYTDATFIQPGMTHPSAINPGSTVRFDSVITLSPTYDFNNNVTYDITDSDSILAANYVNGAIQNGPSEILTQSQRPIDVIDSASMQAVFQDYSGMPMHTLPHDGVSISTNFSQHRNAVGNDFLYRTLQAYTDGSVNNSDMESSRYRQGQSNEISRDPTNVIDGAMQALSIQENMFGKAPIINTLLASGSNQRSASISWGNLLTTLPELSSPDITVIPAGDSGVDSVGQGVIGWHGRYEAQYASEIATAVASLMKRYCISFVGFKIHSGVPDLYSMNVDNGCSFMWNVDQQGTPMFRVGYAGLPDVALQQHFQTYINTIVMPKLACGMKIAVEVTASAFKDMTIIMSLGDEAPLVATAGTFASSLWSPVNTANTHGASNIAGSMLEVFDHISSSLSGTSATPVAGEQFNYTQPTQQYQQQPMQPVQPTQYQQQYQQPVQQQQLQQPVQPAGFSYEY